MTARLGAPGLCSTHAPHSCSPTLGSLAPEVCVRQSHEALQKYLGKTKGFLISPVFPVPSPGVTDGSSPPRSLISRLTEVSSHDLGANPVCFVCLGPLLPLG